MSALSDASPLAAAASLSAGSIIVASLRSVATALTMAAGGAYLTRRKLISKEIVKGFAKVSMNLTIPCLLFTNILGCPQDHTRNTCPNAVDALKSGWPLLFLPAIYVSFGCILGFFVNLIIKPGEGTKPAVLAAIAFGNSTGLPITLIEVIRSGLPHEDHIALHNPIQFLSLYLLGYPVLQWGVGGWLLGVGKPEGAEKNALLGNVVTDVEDKETLLSENHSTTGSWSHVSVNNDQDHAPEEDDAGCFMSGCYQSFMSHKLVKAIMKPPCLAVILGIIICFIPPIKGLLVDDVDRDDDKPLEWLFDGMTAIGKAAVPLNMLILGSKLSNSATNMRNVKWGLNLGIMICKMIIMPAVGLGTAMLANQYLNIDREMRHSFYLVVMIVSCTPTANSILVMAELAPGCDIEALASCNFTQYLFAPVLIAGSLSVFLYVIQNFI